MLLFLNNRGKKTMKKIITIISLVLSFSLILGLTSCINAAGSSGSSSDQTVIFHGSFSVEESYLSQSSSSVMASRSAQPTIPADADLTYYAKATNGSETIRSEDINSSTGTFSIPLKSGSSWTIEVGAKGTSAVNTSLTAAILLKDSVVFNPNAPNNDEPTKEYKFYLKPYVSDGGRGKLNIRIKIQDPSGNKITKVEIVPKKCLNKPNNETAVTAGWNELAPLWNSDKKAVCFSSNLDNFTIIERPSFKSGIWEVAVNFRDSAEQLLYSTIQVICVYDNLETKTWESSKTVADSTELIPSTGENAGVLYLTTLLIDSYGLTDFYVDQTSDDDTENGSPMKPFKTITKAISVVNGLSRLDKTYTIHVKDGSVQDVSDTIVVTANLSIECYKNSYGDRQGSATIRSSCSTGPILQIGNGASAVLTIDGIRKSNNTPDNFSDDTWTGLQLVSNASRYGAATRGVEIKANGSLFMNGGAITNNRCNSPGAGVYISSGAYCIFTGGRITQNNSGTNQGGGIYVAAGGDLLIKGGVIKENTASAGAGIYVAGKVSINGACYISGNTAGSSANNIYLPDNKLIKISGNLDGSTIGITTQTLPTVGTNIRFTDGYAYGKVWSQNKNDDGTYNHPFKYFHSDVTGYSILTDPTPEDPNTPEHENNGDAYLGISGGTITQYTVPEETILFSFYEQSNKIKITITCTDTEWSGSNSSNTHIFLKKNGAEIPESFWSHTYTANNEIEVTLEDTLPAGSYVIEIDVSYGSYVYTGICRCTK